MIAAAPYTQAEILAFLQQTWTAQANVQFEIVQDWTIETVDYDLDNSGGLSPQDNLGELRAIAGSATIQNAVINIYAVKSIPDVIARALPGNIANPPTAVFIGETTHFGPASPLSALAQEVGHVLGIPETQDDAQDDGNVMSDPQRLGATQIRKDDWRIVNPKNLTE